jgi:hypothetical protein
MGEPVLCKQVVDLPLNGTESSEKQSDSVCVDGEEFTDVGKTDAEGSQSTGDVEPQFVRLQLEILGGGARQVRRAEHLIQFVGQLRAQDDVGVAGQVASQLVRVDQ